MEKKQTQKVSRKETDTFLVMSPRGCRYSTPHRSLYECVSSTPGFMFLSIDTDTVQLSAILAM